MLASQFVDQSMGRQLDIRIRERRIAGDVARQPAAFRDAHRERVDFWACDATALPLPENCCSFASSLNLLDAIHSPNEHLRSLVHILASGGTALIGEVLLQGLALAGQKSGHGQARLHG